MLQYNIIKQLQLFDLYYRRNHFTIKFKKEQIGGGLSIIYKDEKIKFEKYFDEKNNLEIFLKTIDEKDNCIVITINNNSNEAYIAIINSQFGECLKTKDFNNGKNYIQIAIQLLEKYHSKLKINKIFLSDDSELFCNGTSLSLSKLSFLQYGDSFYVRFGFLPKDNTKKLQYLKNKEKLKSIKTHEIDFLKIIKKYDYEIEKELLIKLSDKYVKYKYKNIKIWFNKISKILFSINCNLLNYLIEEVYLELKLYQLENILYYKEINMKN
jgi:hypothetical protein